MSDPPPALGPRGRLGAIFLTVFLDLLGFGLVIPLLPRYAQSMQASSLAIGLLGASYSAMQFVFVPVWGRLSDRVGRRPILLGSILATAGSMLMLGWATSLVWLFLARIFGGIATANIATAQAYIADSTAPKERAKGMGLIGMAFGMGFILGPFFGGILASHSLGLPAKVAAGLSLFNFAWAFRALPESLPEDLRAKNRAEKQRFVVGLDVALFRRTWALPGMALGIALFFIAAASFSNLEQTFALYTHDEFGLDSKHTGYILGGVGLVGALVQGGLIGRLSRAYGEVRLIRVGALIQSLSMAGIALAPGRPMIVMYAASMLLSFGNGLTGPSLTSYASRRAPPEMQGGALGILQSMGALARVFGPTWGGFVYGLGHRLPYVTAAIGLFFAAILALAMKVEEPLGRRHETVR